MLNMTNQLYFLITGLPIHMSIWSASTVCLDVGKTISKQNNYQNRHQDTHNRNIHRYVSVFLFSFKYLQLIAIMNIPI